MKISIDVVFISREGKVVKIYRSMKPWKMTWVYFNSNRVLEVKAGSLPLHLKEGDWLEINV